MKTVTGTLTVLCLLVLCSAAIGSGEGTAVGVDPDATARIDSTDRVLQAGTDVSVGELIQTGPSGQVQILFDDQTRLVVGPGSALLIETYLLASNDTAKKLTINALGGSYRFITGNSPKPAYSIKTPTAAIAVRGTKFDLIVTRSATGVLLYDGALRLCGASGDCTELVERCDLGTADSDTASVLTVDQAEHQVLARQFRYARFQSRLLSPFRVTGAIACTESDNSTAGSLAGEGDGEVRETETQNVPTTRGKD